MNILSRNLISADFVLNQENLHTGEVFQINRDKFCKMIDYWKILLVEKYKAQPGQTVMLEFNLTNAYYYSAVFAVWELGMIMIVDWPHAFSLEDATSHRMTMHGKVDFAMVYSRQTDPKDKDFYSFWDYERNRLNCNVIITEQEFDDYQIQDHNIASQILNTTFATPDLDAVWTATGGTTGLPQQIKITHQEIVLQTLRLCKHLNFQSNENTLHTNNLHHGASMCYHFLPSFITSKNHYVFNHRPDSNYYKNLCKYVVDHQINKILLYSSEKLINFLEQTPKINFNLDIVTLFYVNEQCVRLMQEKNIASIRNVFGDTTIGYGFLVKVVDQNTDADKYVTNRIGPQLDDFFEFDIVDGFLHVKAQGLGQTQWKTSSDKFKKINNDYYFYGRGTNFRIGDEWINLGDIDKVVHDLFGVDGATVVIDNEEQQLYLSIWAPSQTAEQEFLQYIDMHFEHIKVNKIARHLNPIEYTVSRKIDRQKLMRYFRQTRDQKTCLTS
jgi:hypothetical protein